MLMKNRTKLRAALEAFFSNERNEGEINRIRDMCKSLHDDLAPEEDHLPPESSFIDEDPPQTLYSNLSDGLLGILREHSICLPERHSTQSPNQRPGVSRHPVRLCLNYSKSDESWLNILVSSNDLLYWQSIGIALFVTLFRFKLERTLTEPQIT